MATTLLPLIPVETPVNNPARLPTWLSRNLELLLMIATGLAIGGLGVIATPGPPASPMIPAVSDPPRMTLRVGVQ